MNWVLMVTGARENRPDAAPPLPREAKANPADFDTCNGLSVSCKPPARVKIQSNSPSRSLGDTESCKV